jgi:hypothetical protein
MGVDDAELDGKVMGDSQLPAPGVWANMAFQMPDTPLPDLTCPSQTVLAFISGTGGLLFVVLGLKTSSSAASNYWVRANRGQR